ncbi:hypothetical protein TeGR_g1555, partial [Tetraparma gracilis]
VSVDYSNLHWTESLVGRWQHFTLTTDNDPEQPNVKLYLDGKLVLDEHSNHSPVDFAGSDGMCIGFHCDMSAGNVRMYRGGDNFHGELDELAFYKRMLSAEEVAATYNKPREPEEDLVFYYDFEDSFDSSFVPNLGSSGSTFDLLLGSNHLESNGDKLVAPAGAQGPDVCRFGEGEPLFMCSAATKPSFLGSGAPLEGAGQAVVAGAVVGGDAVVIVLPGSDDDDPDAALTFVVFASPDLGSVVLNASTGVATPPTALDLSVTCVEDNDSLPIILDMRDPAGLSTSATLISLPSYGSLSALDSSNNVVGTFDSTTELPVSTTLRLVYHPDEDNERTDSFTYTATNTQSLTSEPGRVEVTMFKINDDPKVEDPSATLDDANEERVISIEVVDPDDIFVNVYVNELPAAGTLYYSGDDMTQPVEAYQPSFVGRIDQYVTEVLEFSTFWPATIDGTTRKEVGSDCWNGLAVHAAEGYSEFFTVRYDEPVYITAIEIGEPRGAGSVVSIEAYDYATGTWAQMWSGEPNVKRHNDHTISKQFARFQPDLCHPNFKTDVVRVKTDTLAIDDWNVFDYVKLSGFRDPPPGLVDPSSLLFVPPPNMDCVTSFKFSLSDCAGGSSSRMYLEAVAMAIEEINDKSDGINDQLLPNTIIKYEWRDSAFFAKIDFTDVCFLGQPYDLYSVGAGIDFVSAAKAAGLNVLADVKTDMDIPTLDGATRAMEELDNAGCRAVYVGTQTYALDTIVASAKEAGFAGPESNWIWVFENTAAELVNFDPTLAGTFVLSPSVHSGPAYDRFLVGFAARGNSLGDCSDAADDGGQLLFQRDHDNNISTPMRCGGYDYATGVNNLDNYVAPAFGGDKLISALAQTSFDGVTGPLSFSDVHRGREEGIAVTFKNNKGEAGPQVAGSWTTEGFEYPEGFTKEDIVWSTASGAMPKPAVTGAEEGLDTTLFAVIAAIILGAVLLAAYCWYLKQMKKKFKLERVERQKELKLSMDEKLVKDYTNKMKKQRVYYALEVGDVVSDLSKAIYLAATFTAGREWFLALVVAVGLLALVQAYISIPVRRKMLKHYEGIIEGDMLHIYAEAEYGKKEEGESTVGADNLKLKLDSITLELTLEELNEKTAKIEDLPGLFVFMVEMAAFPEGLSWVSAATGVFSGLMLGRKFSGGAKKEELIAKKRDIEEEMDKLGGGRLSLRGSMKAVESVFGQAAAREMEGEVEAVIGAASATDKEKEIGMHVKEIGARKEGKATGARKETGGEVRANEAAKRLEEGADLPGQVGGGD